MGDLRDLLDEPFNHQTRKWLTAIIDTLLETVPREFRLRESGGYLAGVLEECPWWFSQVEQLRCEHLTLEQSLRLLRSRYDTNHGEDFARLAIAMQNDLRDWMNALVVHNRKENKLLQTAMNVQFGGED